MPSIKVPIWRAVMPAYSDRVTDAFAALMGHLKITQAEIARRLSVSRNTVSAWGKGDTTPSLETMQSTVDVLDDLVCDLKAQVEAMQEVFRLVDESVVMNRPLPKAERERLKADPERLKVQLHAHRGFSERLDRALDKLEAVTEKEE